MNTLTLFYITSITLLIIGGALGVLFFRKVMHAALSLILSLLGVAFFMLFSQADAAAWAQIMVYVGGVVVMIIFGIFFTNQKEEKTNFRQIWFLAPILIFCLLLFANIFFSSHFDKNLVPNHDLKLVGLNILTHFMLVFELLALLLTLALIGVTAIVNPKKSNS